MATTNTVGATKYGMQLTFHNSTLDTDSTKSYNGLNFPIETAVGRGNQLQAFLYGLVANNTTGLVAVINAMNSGYSLLGAALTASNPVTFTTA